MNNTLYNPLDKFDKSNIAPTEIDTYFRHQVIQGYVHDMAAAMEGELPVTPEFFLTRWMLPK